MVTAPNFLTLFNLKTIIRDAALVGIMAIGLTFVTLSGNFFLLSMKETAALCIIAFATGMASGWGFELSFLFTMVFALLAADGLLLGIVAQGRRSHGAQQIALANHRRVQLADGYASVAPHHMREVGTHPVGLVALDQFENRQIQV